MEGSVSLQLNEQFLWFNQIYSSGKPENRCLIGFILSSVNSNFSNCSIRFTKPNINYLHQGGFDLFVSRYIRKNNWTCIQLNSVEGWDMHVSRKNSVFVQIQTKGVDAHLFFFIFFYSDTVCFDIFTNLSGIFEELISIRVCSLVQLDWI